MKPTFEEKIKLVAKEKHLKIIRVEEGKIVALDKDGYKVTFEKIKFG